MTISIFSLVRTFLLCLSVVALLATADSASATPQKRATDSNAGGAEALCELTGGSASTTVEGGVQVEIDGHKGSTKTSTTTCSGGLFDGVSCDNFSNGSSNCAMSMATGDESPTADGDGVVIDVAESEQIVPVDEVTTSGEPELVAVEGPELVKVEETAGEATDGDAATADSSGTETVAEEPALDPADSTEESVDGAVVDPNDPSVTAPIAETAAEPTGETAVEPAIEVVAAETAVADSSAEPTLMELEQDGG